MTNEDVDAVILALRRELLNQWESNHAEHCGVLGTHNVTDCRWPPPAILKMEPSDVVSVPLQLND